MTCPVERRKKLKHNSYWGICIREFLQAEDFFELHKNDIFNFLKEWIKVAPSKCKYSFYFDNIYCKRFKFIFQVFFLDIHTASIITVPNCI